MYNSQKTRIMVMEHTNAPEKVIIIKKYLSVMRGADRILRASKKMTENDDLQTGGETKWTMQKNN